MGSFATHLASMPFSALSSRARDCAERRHAIQAHSFFDLALRPWLHRARDIEDADVRRARHLHRASRRRSAVADLDVRIATRNRRRNTRACFLRGLWLRHADDGDIQCCGGIRIRSRRAAHRDDRHGIAVRVMGIVLGGVDVATLATQCTGAISGRKIVRPLNNPT